MECGSPIPHNESPPKSQEDEDLVRKNKSNVSTITSKNEYILSESKSGVQEDELEDRKLNSQVKSDVRNHEGRNSERGVGVEGVPSQIPSLDLDCNPHLPYIIYKDGFKPDKIIEEILNEVLNYCVKYTIMGEEGKNTYGARPKVKPVPKIRNNMGKESKNNYGARPKIKPVSITSNKMGEEGKNTYGARPKAKPVPKPCNDMGEEGQTNYGARTKVKPLPIKQYLVRNIRNNSNKCDRNLTEVPPPILTKTRDLGTESEIPPTTTSHVEHVTLCNMSNKTNSAELDNQPPQKITKKLTVGTTNINTNQAKSQQPRQTKLENKLPRSTLAQFSRMLGNQPPTNTNSKPNPPPPTPIPVKTNNQASNPAVETGIESGPTVTSTKGKTPSINKKFSSNVLAKFNSMLATKPEPTNNLPNQPTTHPPVQTRTKLPTVRKETPTKKIILMKQKKTEESSKKMRDRLKLWLEKEKTFPQVSSLQSNGTVRARDTEMGTGVYNSGSKEPT